MTYIGYYDSEKEKRETFRESYNHDTSGKEQTYKDNIIFSNQEDVSDEATWYDSGVKPDNMSLEERTVFSVPSSEHGGLEGSYRQQMYSASEHASIAQYDDGYHRSEKDLYIQKSAAVSDLKSTGFRFKILVVVLLILAILLGTMFFS